MAVPLNLKKHKSQNNTHDCPLAIVLFFKSSLRGVPKNLSILTLIFFFLPPTDRRGPQSPPPHGVQSLL